MRETIKRESVKDKLVKDERLNEWLDQIGVRSRREASRLIQEDRVLVDGCPTVMGQKMSPRRAVVYNGVPVSWEASERPEPILLTVNKPRGTVCTTSSKDRAENIVEYLKHPERIHPVGRLDKESKGLLPTTNQEDLVNEIICGDNAHEKEYIVIVDHTATTEFMDWMAKGVYLKELDAGTRPYRLRKMREETFSTMLTQRLNRQIRRVCEAYGYHVKQLVRVRIMNLCLGNLKIGESKKVTPREYRELTRLLKDSTNLPVGHSGQQSKSGEQNGRQNSENERVGFHPEAGGRSLLSGEQGDHEQF